MHILKVMGWYLHPSLVAPAGGEQDSGALGGSLIISQISSRNVYQIVSRTIWEKLPSFRQKDKIKASQGYLLAYAVRSCCHFLHPVLTFQHSLHLSDFLLSHIITRMQWKRGCSRLARRCHLPGSYRTLFAPPQAHRKNLPT